ncbi:hypothetical protein IFM89_009530 [Coptis chinensis]|uniref:Peptide deformylase n=1 Tax=Coptis chinensis TaxID=261450 RepID=A0A835LVF0_9MAGN|nr:hypothetical protein IFM89_009530 [Coptis chinensis]
MARAIFLQQSSLSNKLLPPFSHHASFPRRLSHRHLFSHTRLISLKTMALAKQTFSSSKKDPLASPCDLVFKSPLKIVEYPDPILRAPNKRIGTFDENIEKLVREMFDIMYKTDGIGVSAPQVGINVRLMVFNEGGDRGVGEEIVLINPRIYKYSKKIAVFNEGCLSFPGIYADVKHIECVRPPFFDQCILSGKTPGQLLPAAEGVTRHKNFICYKLTPSYFISNILQSHQQLVIESLTHELLCGFRSFYPEYAPPIASHHTNVKRPESVKVDAQDITGAKFTANLSGLSARVFQHEFDHLQGTLFFDRMTEQVLDSISAELQALEKKFEDVTGLPSPENVNSHIRKRVVAGFGRS